MSTIKISEVEFDQIKQNLIAHFSTDPTFSDYNFEGSALNTIIDILAVNTHMNAVYANALHNEGFLDSAVSRNAVVSRAKELGYTPKSVVASTAFITLALVGVPVNSPTIVLPAGTTFTSSNDSGSYTFYTSKDYSSRVVGANYVFDSVEIKSGTLQSMSFSVSDSGNLYTIPNRYIDTSTLKVYVRDSSSALTREEYMLETSLDSALTPDSKIYFLQESTDGQYQLYFGGGVFGTDVAMGNVIEVGFVASSDFAAPNNCRVFTLASGNVSNEAYSTITLLTPAFGGADRESIDSIKNYAPKAWGSQRRVVTKGDYELYLKNNLPFVKSASVWGGESNVPPVYGKVFCSVQPQSGFVITTDIKNNVIIPLLKKQSVLTVTPEIIDPTYTHVTVKTNVIIDSAKNSSPNALKVQIGTAIDNYFYNSIEQYGSSFYFSQLSALISSVDVVSIVSNSTSIQISRRFQPYYGSNNSFSFSFYRGISPSTLRSSYFYTPDTSGSDVQVYAADDGSGSISLYKVSDSVSLGTSVGKIDYATGKLTFTTVISSTSATQPYVSVYATLVESNFSSINNEIITLSDYVNVKPTGDVMGLDITIYNTQGVQLSV